MNDLFFRDDLDQEKVSLKDDAVVQDKKIISKIENYFSNDQVNAKILLLVGILAIIFGSWHLISGIKNAFVLSPIVLEDKSGIIENLNNLKDTDGDGLSDYEEKYVYGTSPYLSDTDSDGISDYEEIFAGQEPLCIGDTCGLEDEINLEIMNSDSSEKRSLEELKNKLIEAGYPALEINKLSEADLNLIYSEVEKIITPELEKTSAEKIELSEEELEQLKKLSIDQIKLLLIEGGANSEQLNSVSEEELRNLYLGVLQNI